MHNENPVNFLNGRIYSMGQKMVLKLFKTEPFHSAIITITHERGVQRYHNDVPYHRFVSYCLVPLSTIRAGQTAT